MKKSYIYILIVILMITLVVINQKKDSKSFTVNGVKYSTSLDGNSIDSFPSKGNYEVEVDCTNAKGSWNYNKWVARINNITGKVSCNISFTSKTPTNINNYIKGLAGTTQGTGQLVHEEMDYTTPTKEVNYKLSQSQYGTTSQYSASSYSSSSGTAVTNAFSYSNGVWTSNPSNLTSNTYYHLKYTIPENGYYQLCYTLSSGSTDNSLYIYKGSTKIEINGSSYLSASSSSDKNGCINMGNLSTSDSLRVVQRAYTTISTATFYLNKMNTAHYDTGYRYEGKNPNNYIYFNNELWRIIGVFDSSSHGKAGEYLTKIIRNDSLGGYVWDRSFSRKNNWATSLLYNLLNTNYYNATDGTSGGNCYQDVHSTASNCDYTETGIQSEYRSMVENVTWYLGGNDGDTYTSNAFYAGERDSSSVYSGNTASITGYIGLMYASDYGYSVLSSSCPRTVNLNTKSYGTNACGGSSWLKKESAEQTITHYIFSSNLFTILGSLYLHNNPTNTGYSTRPVLYLKSNVQVYAGDGSISNPYQIKLAS